jgi:hypothetical protein
VAKPKVRGSSGILSYINNFTNLDEEFKTFSDSLKRKSSKSKGKPKS